MASETINPKVDAYIAKAQPFAQPILEHLRKLVYTACPDVQESIKWGFPFFEYRGTILCNMSGFKEHCSFGFWGKEMRDPVREAGLESTNSMGAVGKVKDLQDLPKDKVLVGLIRTAAGFIERGEQISPLAGRNEKAKAEKPVVSSPELIAALKKDKKAAAVFAKFSASAKREYIEWIAEAKREETRQKRIATAVEWIGEGKQRNWKYQ